MGWDGMGWDGILSMRMESGPCWDGEHGILWHGVRRLGVSYWGSMDSDSDAAAAQPKMQNLSFCSAGYSNMR